MQKIEVRLGPVFYAGLAVLVVAAVLGWIHDDYYAALGWSIAAAIMYRWGMAAAAAARLGVTLQITAIHIEHMKNAAYEKEARAQVAGTPKQ